MIAPRVMVRATILDGRTSMDLTIRLATLDVAVIGVLGGLMGLRHSRRQRTRVFEQHFVDRYWRLMDQLSLRALRGSPDGEPDEQDERLVRAYFRLCEDELDLRSQGWVSDSTWAVWAQGCTSSSVDGRSTTCGRRSRRRSSRSVAGDRASLSSGHSRLIVETRARCPGSGNRSAARSEGVAPRGQATVQQATEDG